MDGRIGTLEIRYRTRSTDAFLAARLPAITRLLERDLADALDARLTASLGNGREVYVIRELQAATALGLDSLTIDAPVVDHISRTLAHALAYRIAKPDDDVIRFDDTADFVAGFIVDELTGRAADRWYFGAFGKFRHAGARESIDAVLAAHRTEAVVILGRLARRGYLDRLLELLGAVRVLELADVDVSAAAPAGDGVALIEAALSLASLLGWSIDPGLAATLRHALLLNHGPRRPDWTDRLRLTEFVWTVAQDAAVMIRARGEARGPCHRAVLEEALRGRLDWLDGSWILDQIDADAEPHAKQAVGPAQVDRLEVVIGRVVRAVADRRVALRDEWGRDEIVARLIAAAGLEHEDVPLVASLRRVLTDAVIDWRRRLSSPRGTASSGAATGGASAGAAPVDSARSARRRTKQVERQLARALDALSADLDERGSLTSGAGLYLMTRAILDVGLPGLARVYGVPWSALLAGVATAWLGLDEPFDQPTLAWTGAMEPGDISPDLLIPRGANLAALEAALRQRVSGLQVAVPDLDVAVATPPDDDPASVAASLQRVAGLLLVAWARWLRGLEASSPRFLIDRCLRRRSTVDFTDAAVTVALEPAPLDVVLQMAGYLRPIETVPWLGGRSVAFKIVRRFAG